MVIAVLSVTHPTVRQRQLTQKLRHQRHDGFTCNTQFKQLKGEFTSFSAVVQFLLSLT